MAQSISSAEPEKLFRYADFGMQLDHTLLSEASQLASRLQHLEATCTETGYQVSVGHLPGALRGYGQQSESIDGWVRQVGRGFQMADWGGAGTLPMLGGGAGASWESYGLGAALASAITLLSFISVPDWLRKLVDSLPWSKQETPPVSPPSERQTSPGGFGELVRRAEEEAEAKTRAEEEARAREKAKEEKTPFAPPASAVTPGASPGQVPALKQTKGSYECAPTSVSMILQYYHGRDSRHQSLTPKEVITDLGQRFNPNSGINADELVAGLREMDLGYQTVEWTAGLDKETLLAELGEGPVIAQVHLHLGASGYAHMVVVTGISEDGKTVHLNDPWTGEQRELTWEAFEKTWAFPGYPGASNLIVRIRP